VGVWRTARGTDYLDININVYGAIRIGNIEVWITDTIISTWILMGILITFAIVVRIKLRKFKEVPTGFQNAVEAVVELFDSYLRSTAGEKLTYLGSWFFTVFIFILLSNIGGVFPGFRPPTADWSMTIALAIVTFVLIQVLAVRYRKGEYIRSLFQPLPWYIPIFLPMNLISELARPISLSFRLFGNMLSGLVMMTLIYSITPVFTRFVLPAALHVYFDIFAGVLQTYIFCTLSLSFIAASAQVAD